MNNLVVQLLLKTGTFSTDLKTARGQVQNFQKGCQDAGKSLNAFGSGLGINVGALAKFGGAIGAAALAGKELKAIIDSSQTSADAFQGAIAGCKGVLDTFNTAIATADFSAFANGLWDVFDAAKAVQEAMDQLANTQIAYDFKSKENMTKFQEALTIFRDPHATPEQKENARKQMQEAIDAQYQFANNYSSSLYKTYVAQVVKKAGSANLSALNVTRSQFERAMNIDLGLEGDPQEARKKINEQYEHYLDLLDEYRNDWWDRNINDYGEYRNEPGVKKIQRQYKDVIAIHAMLELMKDDELKGIAQLLGGMEDAKQQAISMERTMNRAISGEDRPTTTTRPRGTSRQQKEEFPVDEGSLTYWQNILAEETKYRDALVKDTDEWKEHNAKVEEALEKIEEIKGKVQETSSVMEGSLTWYRQALSEATKLRDETEYGTEAWNKYNEKVKIVSTALSLLERDVKLDEALAVDPPTIESLQTILSILNQIRNATPIGSDEFNKWTEAIQEIENKLKTVTGVKTEAPKTDSWEKFNQAMANTSTIVSNLTNTFKENSEVTAASILQMVATTLPAIGSLISAIGALTTVEAVEAGVGAVQKAVSTSKHWIEAIAAVASLGAVVAAAIAAASTPKMQKFASGGIVGGNSFTGDRVVAGVNSGEMILNRTQQANLFRMANGGTGGQVEFHISGTELVGVLNNQNRKNRLIR